MVDIGCGTGGLIAAVADLGVKCTGIDGSSRLLNRARSRVPAAEFHVGSATALPLSDRSIDGATLIEVVEHLDDEALGLVLDEARRVLRPNGTLMLTTPNGEDLALNTLQCPDCGAEFHAMQHVRSWTAATLVGTLAAAGFNDVRVRATRFVENGWLLERILRSAYYRVGRIRPRLLAFATTQ